MKLNEKILYYRKRAGLSQEALAAKIGVSRQAVSKWELGETMPDVEKLVLLAKAFGVTTDELLGMKEPVRETEQPTPQTSRLPEDVDWVVRKSARFRRWYAPIYVGVFMLALVSGCVSECLGLITTTPLLRKPCVRCAARAPLWRRSVRVRSSGAW